MHWRQAKETVVGRGGNYWQGRQVWRGRYLEAGYGDSREVMVIAGVMAI